MLCNIDQPYQKDDPQSGAGIPLQTVDNVVIGHACRRPDDPKPEQPPAETTYAGRAFKERRFLIYVSAPAQAPLHLASCTYGWTGSCLKSA